LERLETRLIPVGEERFLIIRFIAQDGQVTGTKELKLSEDRPPIKRNRRWWQ